MTRIESKQVDIAKPAAQVHAFLQDMNNFQQLLPQDRISEWKSDGASCSFKVQGAATIGLKLAGGVPDKEVRMESSERSPFKFTLTVHLEDKGGSTRAQQVFEADLNPFIKMMVESPLKHLFDHIADKMVALHGAA
jgi:carbon monoxide dehydrogenase subunit G